MINDSALTVSQLNMYVKMMFESDLRLNKILLVGEISNFVNHYKTGHCYFSLKDDNSAVKAVMFSRSAQNLRFRPENGMRVFVTGRVSVFERDGVYQIYVDTMEPEGTGALMLAFEQLKAKLMQDGVFDDELKQKIPEFPEKIAVVTSRVGAAVQDVINVLSRRYPLAEIMLCPVAAQGVNCAEENINMLRYLNAQNEVDVIILCRGGGSIEDLWGYNDELLVRTVASSGIPVITGIGHETDFTLCDFAADLRAPTPSAAAELAVPDINELIQITDGLYFRLENAVKKYFDSAFDHNENLKLRLNIHDPSKIIAQRSSELMYLQQRAETAVRHRLEITFGRLSVVGERLRLLNPFEMLKKGYIPVFKDDKKVCSLEDLSVNDCIQLEFNGGKALCNVNEIIESEK